MLGAHGDIATTPEPWLLLPQLYALRRQGTFAEYGHRTSVNAIEGFLEHLPNGRADYYRSLRSFLFDIYGKAAGPEAKYFLDKTPRYNLVAGEILNLFPNGRNIVLWRNPLAVVASILETWLAGRWMPHHHKIDLFEGLHTLLDVYMADPSRWMSLRYEELVTLPERELKGIIGALGLAWESAVVERFTDVQLRGAVGDSTGARAYREVSSDPLTKWHTTLRSPVRKAWCRRYLSWIGAERLSVMGYSLDDLIAELDAIPSDYRSAAIDAVFSARGAAWSLLEPDIIRSKAARLPQWRNVVSHS